MIRFSIRGLMLVFGMVLAVSVFEAVRVSAQPWQDRDSQANDGPPVYQWRPTGGHAFDGHRRDERQDGRDFRRDSRFVSPRVSAGWFQRPYPYHLDYYKMRYGGSYAPYFGNLYGTPQVVNYPPYYGPYYGGYGDGYMNGYGQPDYDGVPMEYPAIPGAMMPEMDVEKSARRQTETSVSPTKTSGEALPAPTR